nr:DMT family transporter [Halomonas socia]
MPPALITLACVIGFVVCWSSGFVGGRLAMGASMPILALFAWRFLFASLITGLFWCCTRRQQLPLTALLAEAGIGALTMGGYLLGVILALQFGVSTGLTALVAALQPLLAAALAGRWLGERLGAQGWAGMLLATLGVGICVVDDLGSAQAAPAWAYALPLLSVVSVTLGSLLSVGRLTALPMAATLTVQLWAATLIFTLAALIAAQGRLALPVLDGITLSAIAWLIVLSSLGGYGCFVACLRRLGVTQTSTLVYLTPPVTLVWAALMFGELPGRHGLLGMLVALLGVVIALRRLSPTHTKTPAAGAAG